MRDWDKQFKDRDRWNKKSSYDNDRWERRERNEDRKERNKNRNTSSKSKPKAKPKTPAKAQKQQKPANTGPSPAELAEQRRQEQLTAEQNAFEKAYLATEKNRKSYGTVAEYHGSETHQRAQGEFEKRSARHLNEWNKAEGGTSVGKDMIDKTGDFLNKVANPFDTYYNMTNNEENPDEIKDYLNDMLSTTSVDEFNQATGLHKFMKGAGAVGRFVGDFGPSMAGMVMGGNPFGLMGSIYDRVTEGEEPLSDAEKSLERYMKGVDVERVMANGGRFDGYGEYKPEREKKERTAYRTDKEDRKSYNREPQAVIKPNTVEKEEAVMKSVEPSLEEMMLGVYDENDPLLRGKNRVKQVNANQLDAFSKYATGVLDI